MAASESDRDYTRQALRDVSCFEAVAEDGGCRGNLAHAERPDRLDAVLVFFGGVLFTEMLLDSWCLDLTLHYVEVLSDDVCVHLECDDPQEVLVALDGQLGDRVWSEEGL